MTSSPLKPKDAGPLARGLDGIEEQNDREVEEAMASEADVESEEQQGRAPEEAMEGEPEAEAGSEGQDEVHERIDRSEEDEEPEDTQESHQMLESVREKQKKLAILQKQLLTLQDNTRKLEAAASDADAVLADDEEALFDILELASAKIELAANRQSLMNLGPDQLPYLTLFAPADLQLSFTTTTTQIEDRTKILHTLTLTAPPPWPPAIFGGIVSIRADAQDARIEEVEYRDLLGRTLRNTTRSGLGEWIKEKLQDDVSRYEAATLVEGMGEYWGKKLERAEKLRLLESRYHRGREVEVVQDGSIDVEALTKYLNVSRLELKTKASAKAEGNVAVKVLLLWDIELDWTGRASGRKDLVVDGIGAKVQEKVKELFARLDEKEGVVKAMDGVWSLLCKE